ncbi:hypothetical protein RFEPED_1568 [Rickettsia felis str. Pedreira]|uniref:Uncharacterized protein n=1 Tax=Rickettsia felis str. Pedreira TaxID=1359196 RepID=A0A0F3MUQ6_RICFI|nr:hypothetical protein RFEPED_1568 [Rickettsia felis str. Pedreira]
MGISVVIASSHRLRGNLRKFVLLHEIAASLLTQLLAMTKK